MSEKEPDKIWGTPVFTAVCTRCGMTATTPLNLFEETRTLFLESDWRWLLGDSKVCPACAAKQGGRR